MATTHYTLSPLGRRVCRAAGKLSLLAALGALSACGYKGPLYMPPPPTPEPELTAPPQPTPEAGSDSLEMPEPINVPPPSIAPQSSTSSASTAR